MRNDTIKSLTGIAGTKGGVKKNPNVFSTGIAEPPKWSGGTFTLIRTPYTSGHAEAAGHTFDIQGVRYPITSVRTIHKSVRSRG